MAKLHLEDLDSVNYSENFSEIALYLSQIHQNIKDGMSISEILNRSENSFFFELLTDLRENVLNWYRFDANASVLEIGGDGGALTGFLTRTVHKVVSIEFFDILGEINYARHQEADNLDIYVGNPMSYRSNGAFDYIILNETLSLVRLFFNEEKAENEFLAFCQGMLKPNGKLIIISENRLGLQYFNGKSASLSNKPFDYIEKNATLQGYRGYSRRELLKLVEDCGFEKRQLFYLLPNTKFAQTIFREDYFKNNGDNYRLFSGEKNTLLFDESKVRSTLYHEGISEYFVNAFIIEIGSNAIKKSETLFSKISSDRKSDFHIVTNIEENEIGKKKVVKLPTNSNSAAHLQQMAKYYQLYPRNGVFINTPCQFYEEENCLTFKYLEGQNFEEQLIAYLEGGQINLFEDCLVRFKSTLYDGSKEKIFEGTEAFQQVFGNVALRRELHCKDNVNIDMIFSNIFCEDQEYYVVDYEWVFDFELPVEYVLWRSIMYLYQNSASVRNVYGMNDLLKIIKLPIELQDVFYLWERHFVFCYVGDETTLKYSDNFKILKNEHNKKVGIRHYNSTLSYSLNQNFEESTILNQDCTIIGSRFRVCFDLDNSFSNCFVRWRPIAEPCKIKISNIQCRPKANVNLQAINCIEEKDGWLFFMTADPEFDVIFEDVFPEMISIQGELEYLDRNTIVDFANKKIADKNILIQEYQQILHWKGLVNYIGYKGKEKLKERKKTLSLFFHEIKIQVDSISHFDDKLQIQGWALDLREKEDIGLYVKGNSQEIKITRTDRMDITQEFQLHSGLKPGFCIELTGEMAKKKHIIVKGTNLKEKSHYSVIELTDRFIGFEQNSQNYKQWIKDSEVLEETENLINKMNGWSYQPLISILMPVYNVDQLLLKEGVNSILRQWYSNWELCIIDDCSTNKDIRPFLEKLVKKDNRIRCVFRNKNGHISKATNDAAEIASGEFIALMDDDDVLAPFALYRVVEKLNENKKIDFIYSDEDKITQFGRRKNPFFKPDWSPDTLLSQNYICHFTVIRKSLFDAVGGFEIGLEGAQDHDLFLKCTERTDKIAHIPEILYHWRESSQSTAMDPESKNYAYDAGCKAVKNALLRRNLQGVVQKGNIPGTYIVNYKVVGNPKLSILIPTKDHADDLKVCIDSIIQKSGYDNWEIIVIDNNSNEEQTSVLFDEYRVLLKNRFKVLRLEIPFNFSKLNNEAAKMAEGEYLLLMNNDIEMITENWMPLMIAYAQQSHIGAVGAKLYYPDDTIQHAGVVLGIGGVAGHSHKYFSRKATGYFSRLCIPSNYAGVTAALLMVDRKKYWEVGGLNEKDLKIAFNDVDFNIKLLKAGYYNICLSQVEAYHYESKSRGIEDTPEKVERFQREITYMLDQWDEFLENDPFYSRHLSLEKENFSMKGFDNNQHTNPKLINTMIKNVRNLLNI